MSFNAISTRNTHAIHTLTAFSPSAILHAGRVGLFDFSTRITAASGPSGDLCEKVSDLCWQLWLKVRIYFKSIWTLPSTPRTEVLARSQDMDRFKKRIEQCPVDNYDRKVQLEHYFQELPAEVRSKFTHLSRYVLLEFARESDPGKATKIQQRVLTEITYTLSLLPKLNFLTGIRVSPNNSVPPPVPNPVPNPTPNAFAGTPFANRRARIADPGNEPNELRIAEIKDLQIQRAKEIGAMKLFMEDDYTAPGDTEPMKKKYECHVMLDGPFEKPVFHDAVRQHYFELSSLQPILADHQRLRNCPTCRVAINRATVYLDIKMQKEIAAKLSVALEAMADANIAARLPGLLHDLSQEERADGTTRTITRTAAKARLVTKISDLPDNLLGRVANLYMQRIHAL